MRNFNRSEYNANRAMAEACATLPRTQSVRLLHVAKRKRDVIRARQHAFACRALGAVGVACGAVGIMASAPVAIGAGLSVAVLAWVVS
jgi:hypothetical protein